jgi:hypothetical protein
MVCDHCEALRADLLAATLEYVAADVALTRFCLARHVTDEAARYWGLKSQVDFSRAVRDVAHRKLVDHSSIVHAGAQAEAGTSDKTSSGMAQNSWLNSYR